MMKLIPALVAVADVARSLSVGAEVSADPKLDYSNDPNYFNYDRYHQPDYNQQYNRPLPGADFNKAVSSFREEEQVFDQQDYEERVKVEADLMVALEAMKTSTTYLN